VKSGKFVAVLDIGKTNSRLLLADCESGAIHWQAQQPSHTLEMAIGRQLDVAGVERWLVEALASAPDKQQIGAIVPVTHGAAAVTVDMAGEVLTAFDYEDPHFDAVRVAYEHLIDPYEVTGSPSLPAGLNLGRQLFYLEAQLPQKFEKVARVLLYPQYWAWRLSGVMASEVSSLGCHTHLWIPLQKSYSLFSDQHGWTSKFPPLRFAGETLGTLSSGLAARTGLDRSCRVLCGLHDSNASYLCHSTARRRDNGFTVVSSGTWTVIMAHGVDLTRLSADRGMLANVDVFGNPVATARFMGGREFAAIAGEAEIAYDTWPADLARVVAFGAMALPSRAPTDGPFMHRPGQLMGAEELSAAERRVMATIYLALMTDLRLDELGTQGDLIIDGPLGRTAEFAELMLALRPQNRVYRTGTASAAASAAVYLATGRQVHNEVPVAAGCLKSIHLNDYRSEWRGSIQRPLPHDAADRKAAPGTP